MLIIVLMIELSLIINTIILLVLLCYIIISSSSVFSFTSRVGFVHFSLIRSAVDSNPRFHLQHELRVTLRTAIPWKPQGAILDSMQC